MQGGVAATAAAGVTSYDFHTWSGGGPPASIPFGRTQVDINSIHASPGVGVIRELISPGATVALMYRGAIETHSSARYQIVDCRPLRPRPQQAARPPRRAWRAAARAAPESRQAVPAARPGSKGAVLILPGFVSPWREYDTLIADLQGRGFAAGAFTHARCRPRRMRRRNACVLAARSLPAAARAVLPGAEAARCGPLTGMCPPQPPPARVAALPPLHAPRPRPVRGRAPYSPARPQRPSTCPSAGGCPCCAAATTPFSSTS